MLTTAKDIGHFLIVLLMHTELNTKTIQDAKQIEKQGKSSI